VARLAASLTRFDPSLARRYARFDAGRELGSEAQLTTADRRGAARRQDDQTAPEHMLRQVGGGRERSSSALRPSRHREPRRLYSRLDSGGERAMTCVPAAPDEFARLREGATRPLMASAHGRSTAEVSSPKERELLIEDDDHRLMERVAEGDAASFRRIVERHTGSLSAHATRMLRSASEAEEVVQEAYVRLWKHAPSYRPDAKLRTFLYGIVHNLCVDRLRARKPQDANALDQLTSDDRPSGDLRERELRSRVQREVAALPERQRAALSLVHFEELTNIDAAKLLDVSVDALESLLARARRTLRERLAGMMEQGG
jgi:RNA polymerase sigma-70 factor, ECF subfamily